MKICMLGSKSYPPLIGGIETHVAEISPRLVKLGHEVMVIVGRQENERKEETINGVQVIRVPQVKPSRYTGPDIPTPIHLTQYT